MASESTADPETGSSVPLESVDKPHWHEVSNTLQIYLLVFTIIFVVIIGEFLERTRRIFSACRLCNAELKIAVYHHARAWV